MGRFKRAVAVECHDRIQVSVDRIVARENGLHNGKRSGLAIPVQLDKFGRRSSPELVGHSRTIAAIGASPGAHWCSVPPETKIAGSDVIDAITAPNAARACRS